MRQSNAQSPRRSDKYIANDFLNSISSLLAMPAQVLVESASTERLRLVEIGFTMSGDWKVIRRLAIS
jgi:hypothetical protein